MTLTELASLGALGVGLGVVGLCTLGLIRAKDVYGCLHYGGPANILAPVAVTVALALVLGVTSAITVRGLVIIPLLAITGPIAAHAVARAARLRTRGTLGVHPDDAGAPR